MMMLQRMIVKNGLIRINDQYPRNPRQTIRTANSKSSSFDALSFEDRSASSIPRILFTPRLRTFSQCKILRNWGASKAGSKRKAVNATAPRQAVCKASPFAEHDVCTRGKPLVGVRRPLVDLGSGKLRCPAPRSTSCGWGAAGRDREHELKAQ